MANLMLFASASVPGVRPAMSTAFSTFSSQARALIDDIRHRYGWKLVALVVLMTAIALSEGLGMVLLLPLLDTIGIAAPIQSGGLGKFLASFLASFGAGSSAYRVVVVLLLVFALQLLLYVMQSWWMAWLQRDYCAYWQKRLFDALIHAEWDFFSDQKLGNLTNLITQETARLAGAFLILAQMAAMTLAALVYLAVAFSISWQVTCLIVLLVTVLFVSVKGIGGKNYKIGLRLGPLASELNVLITEYFGGIKLIKATATEEAASSRVSRVVDELRIQHTWATFLPSLVRAIFEFSTIGTICFILVFGYHSLAIPAASMLVVLALFVRLLPRFNALQQNMQLFTTYVPAFSIVRRMLDDAEVVSERSSEYVPVGGVSVGRMSGPLKIMIGKGGYRGVTTLQDIEIELPERGLVGIVGESGAGKSTLVNCLLGLARIEVGTVIFGAVDMLNVPLPVWRRQIGYVPQETVLFHLSIRDNIVWGTPSAVEEEIYTAARQALAHDFILDQPNGYMTVVGDQGVRLSGGQRQRLGIARALLAKPRLLVMDEATSALDSASEASVLETVNDLREDICVVMVAHRLATVHGADLIVVMESGRVVETGSWDELVARRGAFYRLAAAQHIEGTL